MYIQRRCAAAATIVVAAVVAAHTRTHSSRVVAAMLDFGCGTGSHSHFQFVTVSQTAAGRRLARTPLAGRPARSRRVFNKLLVIYIIAAVIRPLRRRARRTSFTYPHSPLPNPWTRRETVVESRRRGPPHTS